MNHIPFSRMHLMGAMLAGLALRLHFIFNFPFASGDSQYYEEFARNWMDHGIYGLFLWGKVTPLDVRMPGYPAFLAAIYAVLGREPATVMILQAFVDLATCILAALLAARLAPASRRTLAATVALWLTALCPFTANYTATVLTETLTTFFTTLTFVLLVHLVAGPSADTPLDSLHRKSVFAHAARWLLAGFLAGVGTLVRPETPLLLAAAGLVIAFRWRRRAQWARLVLAGVWMAAGLLLPLTPWAARNAQTLGRVQFLAPRFANLHGDFVPQGFYAWTGTWMTRIRDAYLVSWKLRRGPIDIATLPAHAIDSDAERARVENLLTRYNRTLQMTPVLDHEFATLARERTARNPIRTFVVVPGIRAWRLWFTPRIESLPYSGALWPPLEKWRSHDTDFSVTLGFGVLGFAYVGLAAVGAWRNRFHPGVVLIVTYLVIRTAFLTQLHTVEPRYVVMCFPAVLALAALAFTARTSR